MCFFWKFLLEPNPEIESRGEARVLGVDGLEEGHQLGFVPEPNALAVCGRGRCCMGLFLVSCDGFYGISRCCGILMSGLCRSGALGRRTLEAEPHLVVGTRREGRVGLGPGLKGGRGAVDLEERSLETVGSTKSIQRERVWRCVSIVLLCLQRFLLQIPTEGAFSKSAGVQEVRNGHLMDPIVLRVVFFAFLGCRGARSLQQKPMRVGSHLW